MEIDIPAWLKIMENGSLGEARTRAFLADRFWVLERSVDVNGADFLVQRRAVDHRFTDKVPPRLGVVQAKYFQDSRTTHYIPVSYVLDERSQPIEGFFALLHVGREDEGEMYLLSARDIVKFLKVSPSYSPQSYVVGTAALATRFKVGAVTPALDQIEHSLKVQSYYQVTTVLDRMHIPYRTPADGDIDFDWTTPLPNPMADVPSFFREKKEELRRVMYAIGEVLETMDQILVTSDPMRALTLLDEVRDNVDGQGRLTFGYFADFDWNDLQDALDVHQRWQDGLRRDGILDAYVALGDELRKALDAKIGEAPLAEIGDFLEVDLTFDATRLTKTQLMISTGSKGGKRDEIVEREHVRMTQVVTEHQSPGGPQRKSPVEMARLLWTFVMRAIIEDRYPQN